MENRHKKGFQACGKNLSVTPDMVFAEEFFAQLHKNFQEAWAEGKNCDLPLNSGINHRKPLPSRLTTSTFQWPTTLPVKLREGVVKTNTATLNFGEEWLKANFEASKAELEESQPPKSTHCLGPC